MPVICGICIYEKVCMYYDLHMNPPQLSQMAQSLGISETNLIIVLALLILWSLYWKGRALWMAAQRADKVWFVVLLVLNSLGILDLMYVCFLAKPGDPEYDGDSESEKELEKNTQ